MEITEFQQIVHIDCRSYSTTNYVEISPADPLADAPVPSAHLRHAWQWIQPISGDPLNKILAETADYVDAILYNVRKS